MRSLAFLTALCAFAQVANASPEAEGLFREGRTLMKDRQFDAACDRFARSYKIEPSITTLLNLGDCHEQAGRTATAWDTFLQAKALAGVSSDKRRAAEAERRAAKLEPQLARLTLTIEHERQVPGLVIRRNRSVVDPAVWNTAAPIDPGEYEIEASAPGRRSTTTKVSVVPQQSAVVVVGTLSIDPNAPRPVIPKPVAKIPTPRRAIGALIGAGERENVLFGTRGVVTTPMPGGHQLRAIASLHFTRYVDDINEVLMKDLHTDTLAFGIGAEYIYFLAPQFGFGGGLGLGADLDFPRDQLDRPINERGRADIGGWLMLRVTPIVYRFTRAIEGSFEFQFVRSGDELVISGIVTLDWFVR